MRTTRSLCGARARLTSVGWRAGWAGLFAALIGTAALAAPSPLEGRWTLVDRRALAGPQGNSGPDVTLEIQGDNLTASAGCNRAAGSIKEQGGRLEIGPLASTMMACPPAVAKVEARFFGVLERGPSYVIKGDLLTLSGAGDTLTFKREPSR